MHVTSKGFKTVDRQNVLLEVDKDVRVDVQLVSWARLPKPSR